jgi:hypothetical protein
MTLKAPLLMAAFSLLSVLSAQAANIKISSLPFAITAPGTYVITGNLAFPVTANVAAITISTAIKGPVIVDLKGFTLTGAAGSSVAIGIGLFAGTGPISNTSPITVRNGTLKNFGFGVWAEGAIYSSIDLQGLAFFTGNNGAFSAGVLFSTVESSIISNCSFSGGSVGIEDAQSPGGNIYINDSFLNVDPLSCLGGSSNIPIVLNRCSFEGSVN